MSPEWISVVCAAGSFLIAAVAFLGHRASKTVRWVWRLVHRLETFFEDFNGRPARPGVPAQKGVLERLAVIETELSYNGGGTLKDAVRRIDQNVKEMKSANVP